MSGGGEGEFTNKWTLRNYSIERPTVKNKIEKRHLNSKSRSEV